jgi:hypothetical protein
MSGCNCWTNGPDCCKYKTGAPWFGVIPPVCPWEIGSPPRVETTTGMTLILGGQASIVAMGWQCPLCKTVHAPHVDACGCQVEVVSASNP